MLEIPIGEDKISDLVVALDIDGDGEINYQVCVCVCMCVCVCVCVCGCVCVHVCSRRVLGVSCLCWMGCSTSVSHVLRLERVMPIRNSLQCTYNIQELAIGRDAFVEEERDVQRTMSVSGSMVCGWCVDGVCPPCVLHVVVICLLLCCSCLLCCGAVLRHPL